MSDFIKKELSAKIAIIFFIALTIWWIWIYKSGAKTDTVNYLFGGVYGSLAFYGGVIALISSKKWGGLKSLIGKSIIFFGLGMLFQALGQYVFWYYNFFSKIEIPYPSLADLGYFGSIPLYIIAALFLSQAAGVHFSLRKLSGQLQAIFIPIFILIVSYFLFLEKQTVDTSNLLKTFFDFGYPIGQAFYISIAVITYSLSRGILGGTMKKYILFFIIALGFQYLADFTFLLFQTEYYNASFIDYIYMTSYLAMTLSLISLKYINYKIRQD